MEAERSSHSALQQRTSELEKEKMLIELELKDLYARHKTELSRRDTTISNVCGWRCLFYAVCVSVLLFVITVIVVIA